MTGRSAQLVVLTVIAVAVLAGLYLVLRGTGVGPAGTSPPGSFALSATPPAPGEPPRIFSVREGEPVTFTIRVEAEGVLHVHGYEKATLLRPGEEASLSFPATMAGRFPVELHAKGQPGRELGTLEVQPR